jgi:branched-chain amino acid transport system substrate-binding protein
MATGRRLVLFLALLGLSGCGLRTADDSVVIAQLLPLTGSDKVEGERARNGARLAIDLAAKNDRRVFGKKVVVHHIDNRNDEELAQAEAVRLITLNKAAALLGGPNDPASTQLARTAQPYAVPVLLTADLPELPPGEAVFCLNAAPATRGEALARFAARELGCHRVIAVVDAEHAAGVALAGGFVGEWRKGHREDKKAAVEEWPYPEELGGGEWTGRLAAAKPDAVLLATTPDKALQMRARLTLPGLKSALLYGGEDRGPEPFQEAAGDSPVLFVATAYSSREKTGPEGETFAREYEEKFRERPDLAAALAYDGVRLLIDALDRAKAITPAPLTAELLAVRDFPGVTGPVSLGERRAKRRIFVVSVKGGEQKVVRTFGPDLE